jgi:hypothetical protein
MRLTLTAVVSTLLVGSVNGNTRIEVTQGNFVDLDPSVQHIPVNPELQHLRPPPPTVPERYDIFMGSTVFRDGYRCGKTLLSAFLRASHPENLHIGLIEQIYEGDDTCLGEYCKLAEVQWPGKDCPYKDQVEVETHSAAEARGCTTARVLQQKLIKDEEFCLQIDAHSYFINGWDEILVEEWLRTENEMAVLTVYPHHCFNFSTYGVHEPLWAYPHLCKLTHYGGGKVMLGRGMIYDHKVPQLGAIWGGGLSFSKCHAEKNVPVDPFMPWIWDGEEFLRSALYWTHGYDLYSPSEKANVIYHNYTKNSDQRSWLTTIDEEVKERESEMAHNRYRLMIGHPFNGMVDTTDLDKYGYGNARTFKEFVAFSGVSFKDGRTDTEPCSQKHWMPYSNATDVEAIVGDGWKLYPKDGDRPGLGNREGPLPVPLKLEISAAAVETEGWDDDAVEPDNRLAVDAVRREDTPGLLRSNALHRVDVRGGRHDETELDQEHRIPMTENAFILPVTFLSGVVAAVVVQAFVKHCKVQRRRLLKEPHKR